MKNKEVFKEKIRLCSQLMLNIIIAYIISILLFFLFIDGIFERSLANKLYNYNTKIYYWFVQNKSIVIAIYLILVMSAVVYRFISKHVNNINQVYNALDCVLNEDMKKIDLPTEVMKFSEKINKIKYDYILSEKNAKEAEQKKNDLIVYMAHDIKTPLTSIIGYLTLLIDEKDIPKNVQEKYMDIVLKKALRVEDLTNQFFDITRYNLQSMPITKQNINLVFLLEQLLEESYPMLQEKALKYNLKKTNPIEFMGDGDKLARAFGNLLKNAINYSYENTTIELNIKQENEKIEILFRNKGDKIPEYKLEKIFDKFYRVDESRTSSTGGAGLGLAITKEIIELHNGRIYARNDNEYIEFYIELYKDKGV